MLSSVRNLSKSTVGTIGLVIFLLLVLASFALADLSNIRQNGFGLGSDTLAEADGRAVTERDFSDIMQQQLAIVRQSQPDATMADLEGQFDAILSQLIGFKALAAFADNHGFGLSKALVDAEIAQIPGVEGLDGRFTTESYQAYLQSRQMTDAQFRSLVEAELYQRLLIMPATSEMRIPSSFATPYAASLLEQRSGRIATLAADNFASGVEVTDKAITQYYRDNAARYTIPERRVVRFARLTPDRFADVKPSQAEIEEAMANGGATGSQEIRVISQAVLPTEAAAREVAQAARRGSFVDAVVPKGFSAADVSVGPQSREEFTQLAGREVANAVFARSVGEGSIVGPVRSQFGWHVVRVEDIENEDGRSEADLRAEVTRQLTERKRQEALFDLASEVENGLVSGASFTEAAQAAGLDIIETPPITAAGKARDGSSYSVPEDLIPALPSAFALQTDDTPVLEPLGEGKGYVMVGVTDIIEAAPAPLADIRDQVRSDYVKAKANERARAAAQKIQERLKKGEAFAAAVRAVAAEAKVSLPAPENVSLQRLALSQFQGNVPAPIDMLFRLRLGDSRMAAAPNQSGVFVVKLDKVVPGDTGNQPGLVTQLANEFRPAMTNELAQQFTNSIIRDVGVTRNDEAIAAAKARLLGNN
ncbi:peptidylprolyl isomerase [Sphingomicrobium lutaoense]|uniref:Parvulin-like PPIase n=1 Tax=Sphingomicrobium lutaoense TaxID=515949 RepID=A0A839Z5A4_9SPHN|nr:peptidylprolyl isomerase [Sphingomicrobium lutaoense]MBB3763854.1 peptidyl-prolyl cis-trans isomerase D [Sphingomicrobium lutaoense]